VALLFVIVVPFARAQDVQCPSCPPPDPTLCEHPGEHIEVSKVFYFDGSQLTVFARFMDCVWFENISVITGCASPAKACQARTACPLWPGGGSCGELAPPSRLTPLPGPPKKRR
jgi:hypothetical protein